MSVTSCEAASESAIMGKDKGLCHLPTHSIFIFSRLILRKRKRLLIIYISIYIKCCDLLSLVYLLRDQNKQSQCKITSNESSMSDVAVHRHGVS